MRESDVMMFKDMLLASGNKDRMAVIEKVKMRALIGEPNLGDI